MTQTAQMTQEKEDIGFYARVPRIVRTGYQELSHAEKWLYTCLRDLCGEAGECWRSLRALAKETGISIASLSSMIPHLAQVGLIDAVKKSTWFIKIVNIWKANREHCSKNEHSASGCSENEQGCSNFVTKEDISKKIESEEDNTKNEDISITIVNADELRPYIDGYEDQTLSLLEFLERETNKRFPDIPPSLPLTAAQEAKLYTPPVEMVCISENDNHSHIASPKATRKKAGKAKPGELTLQGQHILDEYQKFKGRKSTPGKATIEAANGLVGLVASDEEFTAVLTEIRDNQFLNEKSIARDLDFVFRKYERYRDIVEQKAAKTQPNGRPAPPPGIKDYTGMGRLLHQQEARRGQTFTA